MQPYLLATVALCRCACCSGECAGGGRERGQCAVMVRKREVGSVVVEVVLELRKFAERSTEAACGIDVVVEWAHGLLRSEEDGEGASGAAQRSQVDRAVEGVGGAVEEVVRHRFLGFFAGGAGGREDLAYALKVPIEGDMSCAQLEKEVSVAAG